MKLLFSRQLPHTINRSKLDIQKRLLATQATPLKPATLQQAVEMKDLNAIKKLLSLGENPIQHDKSGSSAISLAYTNGSSIILDSLLAHAKQNEQLTPELLQDCLSETLYGEHQECSRLLLQYNAPVKVEMIPAKRIVPLTHSLIMLGATAAYLSELRDPTYYIGEHTSSLLTLGASLGAVGTSSSLLSAVLASPKPIFGMTWLHQYAQDGSLHKVHSLVKQQPLLINSQCKLGMTPAHMAAQNGNVEVLKFLADDVKADLALRNIADQTVYDTALRHNESAAAYLKSIGATQSGESKKTKAPRNTI